MPTLSFCILNDLHKYYGPIHIKYEDDLPGVILDVITTVEKDCGNDMCYINSFVLRFIANLDYQEIADDLLEKGYCVYNRVEKYYVVAFALDYTRFEVFSKDFDRELIKWRENDQDDPITGLITDEDYNENPVITLLKSIHGSG